MGLNCGYSVSELFLIVNLAKDYMEKNNITNPEDVDAKIIQEKYDEIMKKFLKEPE